MPCCITSFGSQNDFQCCPYDRGRERRLGCRAATHANSEFAGHQTSLGASILGGQLSPLRMSCRSFLGCRVFQSLEHDNAHLRRQLSSTDQADIASFSPPNNLLFHVYCTRLKHPGQVAVRARVVADPHMAPAPTGRVRDRTSFPHTFVAHTDTSNPNGGRVTQIPRVRAYIGTKNSSGRKEKEGAHLSRSNKTATTARPEPWAPR